MSRQFPCRRFWSSALVVVMALGVTVVVGAQGWVGPRPAVGPADRPVIEPAAVARGRVVWAAECITCHGASARGTATAPNLLHSLLVLRDRAGSDVGPFLRKGHPMQSGKPSAGLTDTQIADVMQFVRDRINDTLRGSPVFIAGDVLVGNAAAGAAYFNGPGQCTTCHSASGDLKGVATRNPNPIDLQQRMLFPPRGRVGGAGGRGAAAAPSRTTVTVTLTPASGAAMSGELVDEDDFDVTYRDGVGVVHVVARKPGLKVEKNDPLRAHRELLDRVTDTNIHDLVAYLVTVK